VAVVCFLAAATAAMGGGISPGLSSAAARAEAAATPTSTPTPAQLRAEAVLGTFYTAYDRLDAGSILALFATRFKYSDCNYSRHRYVIIRSQTSLQRWLRDRFHEDDQFRVLGPFFADPGPGMVGAAGPVTRSSDSIDPLTARGLLVSVPSPKFGIDADGRIVGAELSTPGLCLAGTQPHGSKPKKERALARSFLTAYNRHDVTAVLALLARDVVYSDCGGPPAQDGRTGRDAATAWLRQRFTAGDRIQQPRIVTDSWLSEPPNNILTVEVQGVRTGAAFAAHGAPQPVTIRIVPNLAVTRIRLWQVWGGCPPASS
jgi:hypothetical protein